MILLQAVIGVDVEVEVEADVEDGVSSMQVSIRGCLGPARPLQLETPLKLLSK